MAVAVRGVFVTLGSFGSGWLLRITTSYVMVLVCIGGLEVVSLIFLIAWERQPSFEVIIIVTAIFGLCYGLNATVGLGKQFTETHCVSLMGHEEPIVQLHVISLFPTTAYSGTAPGDSVAGYCALVVEHTGAQAVQYFVSEYISAEANLYIILVVTILAVPLFTVADIHYGSGTSRNICGKKRLASTPEDSGCDCCEPATASVGKENSTYAHMLRYCLPEACPHVHNYMPGPSTIIPITICVPHKWTEHVNGGW